MFQKTCSAKNPKKATDVNSGREVKQIKVIFPHGYETFRNLQCAASTVVAAPESPPTLDLARKCRPMAKHLGRCRAPSATRQDMPQGIRHVWRRDGSGRKHVHGSLLRPAHRSARHCSRARLARGRLIARRPPPLASRPWQQGYAYDGEPWPST